MRTVRIPARLSNSRTWSYLAGVVMFWILARLFEPTTAGAIIPGIWLPPCPLKALSGIPCPFCGLTTGTAWIVRWHFLDAWNSNILSLVLFFFWAALGTYSLFFRLIAGRAIDCQLSKPARRLLWLAGGLAVAISWLINLHRTF